MQLEFWLSITFKPKGESVQLAFHGPTSVKTVLERIGVGKV